MPKGNPVPKLFTARILVAFTAVFIIAYILWIGPERFYYESFGTWLLSPVIYFRLLPSPFNAWLLHGLLHFPLLSHILCTIPVAMLLAAFCSAIYSLIRNSLPFALVTWLLVSSVFVVYHHLQPLGITFMKF